MILKPCAQKGKYELEYYDVRPPEDEDDIGFEEVFYEDDSPLKPQTPPNSPNVEQYWYPEQPSGGYDPHAMYYPYTDDEVYYD